MKEIKNLYIKLKENLDPNDYAHINRLQKHCFEIDKTALKLEINHKLSRNKGIKGTINNINEFMYYNNDELIGYVGIGHFGGNAIEVNGMVDPEFRRRGIFKGYLN